MNPRPALLPRVLGYCLEQVDPPVGTKPHRCHHVHGQPEQAAACQHRLADRHYEVVRAVQCLGGCIITSRTAVELGASVHDLHYLGLPVVIEVVQPPASVTNVSQFARARRRGRR